MTIQSPYFARINACIVFFFLLIWMVPRYQKWREGREERQRRKIDGIAKRGACTSLVIVIQPVLDCTSCSRRPEKGIFSIRVGRAIDEWKESFVAPILINNRSRACRSARNTIRHRSFGSINVEREKILRRPRRTTTLRCSIFHLQEITIIIFLRLRSIYIYICTRDFVTLSIRFSSIKVEIEKKKKERKKDDLEESRRSIFEINDYNDYFFFDYDRS